MHIYRHFCPKQFSTTKGSKHIPRGSSLYLLTWYKASLFYRMQNKVWPLDHIITYSPRMKTILQHYNWLFLHLARVRFKATPENHSSIVCTWPLKAELIKKKKNQTTTSHQTFLSLLYVLNVYDSYLGYKNTLTRVTYTLFYLNQGEAHRALWGWAQNL